MLTFALASVFASPCFFFRLRPLGNQTTAGGEGFAERRTARPARWSATPIVSGAPPPTKTADLEELTEADRKAAEKQNTCPVSGAQLP